VKAYARAPDSKVAAARGTGQGRHGCFNDLPPMLGCGVHGWDGAGWRTRRRGALLVRGGESELMTTPRPA